MLDAREQSIIIKEAYPMTANMKSLSYRRNVISISLVMVSFLTTIFLSGCKEKTPLPSVAPTKKEQVIKDLYVTAKNVNIRALPSINSAVLGIAELGMYIGEAIVEGKEETINGKKGTWLKFSSKEFKKGYIFSAFVKEESDLYVAMTGTDYRVCDKSYGLEPMDNGAWRTLYFYADGYVEYIQDALFDMPEKKSTGKYNIVGTIIFIHIDTGELGGHYKLRMYPHDEDSGYSVSFRRFKNSPEECDKEMP